MPQVRRRGSTSFPERIDVWLDEAARRALELAGAEALRSGRRSIDPGDLLSGLAEADGELFARILTELGATAENLRAAAGPS